MLYPEDCYKLLQELYDSPVESAVIFTGFVIAIYVSYILDKREGRKHQKGFSNKKYSNEGE